MYFQPHLNFGKKAQKIGTYIAKWEEVASEDLKGTFVVRRGGKRGDEAVEVGNYLRGEVPANKGKRERRRL